MRWPLGPFGRFWSQAPRSEPAQTGRAAPARPAGRAWASLPPIARAAGDLVPTAGAREFAAGLPGAVGLPRALWPLGHARSPEAPAGRVSGLATPAALQRYAGQEPLVLAGPGPDRPRWSWPAAAPQAEPEAGSVSGSAEPVPAAVPAPVAVEEVGTPAAAALPAPTAPRPVPSAPAAAAAGPPAPLTASRLSEVLAASPAAAGPRPGDRADVSGSRAVPPIPPPAAAEPAPTPIEPPRRLNLGQSRRRGLGPPLTPAAARAVQRAAAGPGQPAPALVMSEARSSPPAAEPPGPAGEVPTASRLLATSEPARPQATGPTAIGAAEPDLPVQRLDHPDDAAGAGETAAGARPSAPPGVRPAPGEVPPSPGPATRRTAETVRPIHRVQRRPADVPALPPIPTLSIGGPAAGPGTPPGLDPARPAEARTGAAQEPAAAVSRRSTDLTPATHRPLSRPAASGTPAPKPAAGWSGSPGPLAGARPLVTAPMIASRSAGEAPRAPRGPGGGPPVLPPRTGIAPALAALTAPAAADAWPSAVQTAAARPEDWPATLPVATVPARPAEPDVAVAAGPGPVPVSPLPLAAARLPGPPTPPEPGPAWPEPGIPAVVELPVQRAEAPAAAPATVGAPAGHSDKELDDLAQQLYERLRSRLRLELLVDRERAGLITDLR